MLDMAFERQRLPDIELTADPASLPRRKANFITGLERMPVKFTPTPDCTSTTQKFAQTVWALVDSFRRSGPHRNGAGDQPSR